MSTNFVANIKGEKGDPGTPGPFVVLQSGASFNYDLNDLVISGDYFINTSSSTIANIPGDGWSGNWLPRITVVALNTSGRVWQRIEGMGGGDTSKAVFTRYRASAAVDFSGWQRQVSQNSGGGVVLPLSHATARLAGFLLATLFWRWQHERAHSVR